MRKARRGMSGAVVAEGGGPKCDKTIKKLFQFFFFFERQLGTGNGPNGRYVET